MAKTFKEAFGDNAELYRTNDPNEMFAVRNGSWAAHAQNEDEGGSSFPSFNAPPTPWKFDQRSNSFIDPKDSTHKISASDIGLGGYSGNQVPLALTELAHKDGALKDPWAQYAIDHHPEWKTDQIVGALHNDTQEIIRQSAPSGLDKFMETAIPLVVGGAMAAGALGFGSALAGAEVAPAAAGGATATTGGMFVGSEGLIPGFGNTLVDSALNGAVKNMAVSLVTGGDVGKAGISGLIGGGVSGMLPTATDMTGKAINAGISGATSGGVNAALNGGDILKGAATGGASGAAGSLASNYVTGLTDSKGAGGAAGGAASALATGLINGKVDPNKILNSAITGGSSGLAQDYGASPETAGAISTLTGAALNKGNIIGTGVNPNDNVSSPTGLINTPSTPVATPSTTTPVAIATPVDIESNHGFGLAVPIEYQHVARRDMNWGHRTGE